MPAGIVCPGGLSDEMHAWCCRVLANVLFPNWLVTMMLLGLLIFLTYKTGKKALSLHRCEVRYLAQREENASGHTAGQGGQGRDSGKAQRGAQPAGTVIACLA